MVELLETTTAVRAAVSFARRIATAAWGSFPRWVPCTSGHARLIERCREPDRI